MTTVLPLHLYDVFRGAFLCLLVYWFYRFVRSEEAFKSRTAIRRRTLMAILLGWQIVGCFYATIPWWPDLFAQFHVRQIMAQMDAITTILCILVLTEVTHRRIVTPWVFLAHVTPFVLFAIVGLFVESRILLAVESGILVLYILVFSFLLIRAWLRFNHFVQDHFGTIEGHDIHWLRHVAVELLLILACWCICYIPNISPWVWVGTTLLVILIENSFFYRVYSIILTYETAHTDDREDMQILLSEPKPDLLHPVPEPEQPTPSAADRFAGNLKAICEDTRLYTNEDITRLVLCEKMHIGTTQFTTLLNRTTGKTFHQYINDLRLDYAEQLLHDPSIPIDKIPERIGYKVGSKSTFYRAFSARYSCTPSEYRKYLLSKQ